MMRFDWDTNKAATNLRKHGVSFQEASTVFADENARLKSDLDHSEQEFRFILLGLSARFRVVVVCHCYRENDTVIRIISARKATSKERDQYWSYL
ncbi:MAG: BrnT family toxin [Candidatus Sumerlaeaceae bacterium]|nr:BrnT family toxin [Candidatus Sumerlaeaceae bacterium]